MTKNKALFIGAIINFIISVGHIVCLGYLQKTFQLYGITDIMNKCTINFGVGFPYIITIIIALCFFACGLYGLSASGIIRRLPLQRLGIFAIATVFIFRALCGVFMLISNFTFLELSSTFVSALVGLLYLLGGIQTYIIIHE